jgi:S-adenosylmethionine:tRNA ribosyltransferase-isomerase
MKLSQFKFKLPEEQIAQYPCAYEYDADGNIVKRVEGFDAHRDECRLMVLHAKSNRIEHRIFKDLIEYFGDKDLFVFNDTQVFPALMHGNKEKTNALIEVFLLRELNQQYRLWDVLVEPARKIRVGNKLYFGADNSMVAEVIDNTTSRGRTVRFLYDGTHEEFKRDLFALGNTPLPAHIKRAPEADDADRYQCIFAKNEGAVVLPAAGANFSRELMKRLEIRGAEFAYVTLHASLGMFREIDVEDLTKHKADSEQMDVSEEASVKFNAASARENKICAVGTTTLRALETASTANGEIKPFEGWTNRFIFPPYQFTTANCLISNFQLPYSMMLMNQAAFGGYDEVMNAYNIALKEGYRFGFYGDALLILPD